MLRTAEWKNSMIPRVFDHRPAGSGRPNLHGMQRAGVQIPSDPPSKTLALSGLSLFQASLESTVCPSGFGEPLLPTCPGGHPGQLCEPFGGGHTWVRRLIDIVPDPAAMAVSVENRQLTGRLVDPDPSNGRCCSLPRFRRLGRWVRPARLPGLRSPDGGGYPLGMDFALWAVDAARPVIATAIHAGHDLRAEVAPLMLLDDATRRREEDPPPKRSTG